ncbi:MAG: chromosomal replication initiator protein DnaA [Phycisphaera sp.]|nr:chromosomal replication initiator protein DnaA [Phycisphaera sp.]
MAIPDPVVWRDMLTYLRKSHSDICRQWFDELEPVTLEGGVLEVKTNNAIQRNYLANKCIDQFNEAAQTITGALVAIRFVDGVNATPNGASAAARPHSALIDDDDNDRHDGRFDYDTTPRVTAGSVAPRRQPPAPAYVDAGDDQLLLSPDYNFDSFVTGPGNRLAHAAAVAVAEQPGRAYNPLFIHGGVGLGKTHLLQAICHTVLTDNPDARICYLSCDTFVHQFLDSVQNGQMSEFRHRYRHVDMLLIDDIHFLTNRERTQEEFFHTFNTLYQANKQIVLSSDSPPNEIPQLEERLTSRFNWGLVARVDKPCYETRVAILKKKAAIRGIQVPNDVVSYIASRIESNTRELEGSITKILSLSMLRDQPIDMSMAQEALGDQQPLETAPQLTIQNIIDAVTDFYGVKLADLQSKRRHRSITIPRQVCMYLARKRTRYSLEEIGGYFGGRDHTTVMHAIRTTDDRMSEEAEFAREVEQIDRTLTGAN